MADPMSRGERAYLIYLEHLADRNVEQQSLKDWPDLSASQQAVWQAAYPGVVMDENDPTPVVTEWPRPAAAVATASAPASTSLAGHEGRSSVPLPAAHGGGNSIVGPPSGLTRPPPAPVSNLAYAQGQDPFIAGEQIGTACLTTYKLTAQATYLGFGVLVPTSTAPTSNSHSTSNSLSTPALDPDNTSGQVGAPTKKIYPYDVPWVSASDNDTSIENIEKCVPCWRARRGRCYGGSPTSRCSACIRGKLSLDQCQYGRRLEEMPEVLPQKSDEPKKNMKKDPKGSGGGGTGAAGGLIAA